MLHLQAITYKEIHRSLAIQMWRAGGDATGHRERTRKKHLHVMIKGIHRRIFNMIKINNNDDVRCIIIDKTQIRKQ